VQPQFLLMLRPFGLEWIFSCFEKTDLTISLVPPLDASIITGKLNFFHPVRGMDHLPGGRCGALSGLP